MELQPAPSRDVLAPWWRLWLAVTPEQEIWAVALWVEKHHSSGGPRYVAEQIGRLAIAGDNAGIETWVAIARALDKLTRPEGL